MLNEITNLEDLIDSRDIIARIEELEAMAEEGDIEDDEREELASLLALQSEAEGYCPDWRYGATLIRATYFEEYAEQMAEDIGAIDPKAGWPLMHIDWEAAARSLQQDYTEVDFGGVSYWVR